MSRIRKILAVASVVFFCTCMLGADHSEKILDGANKAAEAFVTGDHEQFIGLIYPKLVEVLGGKEEMLSMLKSASDRMESQGVKILSQSADSVSEVVTAGDELHAVVTTKLELQVPGGRVSQKSFMIAVSSDEGASWTYLDGPQLSDETSRQAILPNFNAELVLPKQEQPDFHTDP